MESEFKTRILKLCYDGMGGLKIEISFCTSSNSTYQEDHNTGRTELRGISY